MVFYRELEAKTNWFAAASRLGGGGCGVVYRCAPIARVGGGQDLAVKRCELAHGMPSFDPTKIEYVGHPLGYTYTCMHTYLHTIIHRFEVAHSRPSFFQEVLVLGACLHPFLLPILAISGVVRICVRLHRIHVRVRVRMHVCVYM